jgi:hypothetical protein
MKGNFLLPAVVQVATSLRRKAIGCARENLKNKIIKMRYFNL